MLGLFNPYFLNTLVPSGEIIIRRWIGERYEQEEGGVKKILVSIKYAKYILFDIWSLPNSYALLGIVAHFMDA
jgi:hypothetical protein